MSRYNFVSSIFFWSERDRSDYPAFFNALDELIHVLINFYFERVVGEIINF